MTTDSKHPETLVLHGGTYRKDTATMQLQFLFIKQLLMSLIAQNMPQIYLL